MLAETIDRLAALAAPRADLAQRLRDAAAELDRPVATIAVAGEPGQGAAHLAAALHAHGLTIAAGDAPADAFVLASDGHAPLTAGELRRLAAAARHTAILAVAVTQADEAPHADEVAAADRALVGAAIPVVPVSARLAELAAAGGERAERRRRASGLDRLAAVLTRETGLRRVAAAVAAELAATERAGLAATRDAGAALAALERETAGWPRRLADEVGRLDGALMVEFGRAAKALEQRYDDAALRRRDDGPEALATELQAEVRAIGAALQRRLCDEVAAIEARLELELEAGGALPGLDAVAADLAAPGDEADTPWTRKARIVQSALGPGVLAVSLARLGVLGAAGALAFPLGLSFGGVLAAGEWRRMKEADRVAPLRRLVADALYQARNEVPPLVRAELRQVQHLLDDRCREALAARRAALVAASRPGAAEQARRRLVALDVERAALATALDTDKEPVHA